MPESEPASPQSVELLRLLQSGDEAAAEAIFERYAERLTRLARSRLAVKLASRIDPEDIVMSAYRSFFVAAREGRFHVSRGGDLWRLLVEVTLHKLYRQAAHHGAQRRSVAREQPLGDESASAGIALSHEPSPDEAVAAADELEAILAQLPERGRQALELRLQGYEHEEIAERLGCSERTVRRALSEARRIMAARGGRGFVPGAARKRPATNSNYLPAPPAVALPHIDAPLQWNDYLLQEQIGAGATGKVYRALRRNDHAEVAVKFLKKSLLREPAVVARFLRESQIVAQIADPGIVAIHGAGRTPGGGCFLAMDLVRGFDLHRLASESQIDSRQSAHWVAEAARAVQRAHQQGIIHCDLKPSNLLLDEAGRIRVTDFGLALRLTETATTAGLLAGTPAFMAPEQVDPCWGPISPRTDVYGLGAVLYFLLTQRPPHTGATVAEVLRHVLADQTVTLPEGLATSLSSGLLDILGRCLAKTPAERFSSAAELEMALRRCAIAPEC